MGFVVISGLLEWIRLQLVMARTPRFTANNTDRGWLVNVPQTVSETGKRIQRYFPTREKATEFAKGLRENYKDFGNQARNLSPGDVEDATKALELLKDHGVNLVSCARFYVVHHDRRAKAPTMGTAMANGIKLRKELSSRYRQSLKNLEKRLPVKFSAKNVVDLTPADVSEALTEMTNGTTAWKNALRMFSAILGDLVMEGILHENPCTRVPVPKIKSCDEVRIYTVGELTALFGACKDYENGADPKCSACAVPFAFLAFAGIRPAELSRLNWADVNLELSSIRLSGKVTKTGKTRNVRINSTLRAWIDSIPEQERKGRVIPGRWTQKATRVRREAGLDGLELQDALRHSYGSYMLGTENDLNALKSDMGHQHCDVFFNHYHNAITREKAAPFWLILPPI